MGGAGSGNHYHWWRSGKKTTVEECRHLDANRWMREGILKANVKHYGQWCWRNSSTGQQTAAISYEVFSVDPTSPRLRLQYNFPSSDTKVDYHVELATTCPRYGGLRWWFICPLIVSGHPCKRRVGKLFLPPQGRYFGCRHCYDLTYTSCQESRKDDPLCRFMAGQMGFDLDTTRQMIKRIAKRGQHHS